MTNFTDDELYRRGAETLIASWEAYARGTPGAFVHRTRGISAAVFPTGPERGVYNNTLLARDLESPEQLFALEELETIYAEAGIDGFAVWVHESDASMRHTLERRGYEIDASTRSMGMAIEDIDLPAPGIELGTLDWPEYLQLFGLPSGLLSGADHSIFKLLFACLEGEIVATTMAFDHNGDCGIYNVATLERARRRGLSTALTRLQIHQARTRGCQTASLQSTPMAERVYAAAGFRDLGRVFEYVR